VKIGIICNHFSFASINYLLTNKLVAGFAVPEVQNPGIHNIELLSETYNVQFNILHKNTLSEDLIDWLLKINPDVVYIFSFPYKIPEKVLTIPRFGFINFHPGILPSYRGPDPIFWQLKNGETESGITAYKLDKDFDTGPVIHIEKEQIDPFDTYGSVSKKLADTLSRSVVGVTDKLKNNLPEKLNYVNQDEKLSSYYGNPKREDLVIDWEKQDAVEIYNLVRASNPKYQGAITIYKNFPVRILQASIEKREEDIQQPGTIINDNLGLKISTIDKKIISLEVIYSVDGYCTGKTFKELFNVHFNERFGTNKNLM
jgi:methionyl-tRNA formyltransferase